MDVVLELELSVVLVGSGVVLGNSLEVTEEEDSVLVDSIWLVLVGSDEVMVSDEVVVDAEELVVSDEVVVAEEVVVADEEVLSDEVVLSEVLLVAIDVVLAAEEVVSEEVVRAEVVLVFEVALSAEVLLTVPFLLVLVPCVLITVEVLFANGNPVEQSVKTTRVMLMVLVTVDSTEVVDACAG